MTMQLMDIHGLDAIPWWPLAAGWWLAGALLILALLMVTLLIRHIVLYPPGSWSSDARAALRQLRRSRESLTPKERAGRLSELLRRIAIARFGRPGTASLAGDDWLERLQQSDPNGYDWRTRGRLLLTLPYAPESYQVDQEAIDGLIQAALRLVRNSKKRGLPRARRWGVLDV